MLKIKHLLPFLESGSERLGGQAPTDFRFFSIFKVSERSSSSYLTRTTQTNQPWSWGRRLVYTFFCLLLFFFFFPLDPSPYKRPSLHPILSAHVLVAGGDGCGDEPTVGEKEERKKKQKQMFCSSKRNLYFRAEPIALGWPRCTVCVDHILIFFKP